VEVCRCRQVGQIKVITATFMLSIRHLVLAVVLAAPAILAPNNPVGAVTAGAPCGPGRMCDKGLWCEPVQGNCTSPIGVCVAVPRLCFARKKSKGFHPVCGCNGKTYSSECFRRAQRIAKLRDGKC
jgi:Kazal-type serine protease inhibitor domain